MSHTGERVDRDCAVDGCAVAWGGGDGELAANGFDTIGEAGEARAARAVVGGRRHADPVVRHLE